VPPQQFAIPLSDSTCIGEARRIAARAAQRAGLEDSDAGRVAIVATELATNVIRHAANGEMLICGLDDPVRKGVELIVIDRGPGMADVARCMADGYSSAGTRGQGLGAVHRLSTQMDVYSAPARGTAVYSRVEAGERGAPTDEPPPWCAISVPAPGETECGDSWRIMRSETHISAVVADGLGHGPLAAKAAHEAIRVFEQRPFSAPEIYLEVAHKALHATRGAALACARADLRSRTLQYAGVGNICASLVGRDAQSNRSLTSHNGTAGLQVSKLQQFQYQWLEGDLLLMHSDGLTTRWKLADYPGLSRRAPALIAAILYRDFKRGRDDTTVLVARLK
jgi:anti-sigma regulatory factor (Ser/Thr protein kinase)